jgi:hypothetical protein
LRFVSRLSETTIRKENNMSNDPISDPENEPAVIDPGGQGTGGGNISTSASSDEVTAFAEPDETVIDPGGQGTGGGGSTTDAAIDPGGQGTGGGQ